MSENATGIKRTTSCTTGASGEIPVWYRFSVLFRITISPAPTRYSCREITQVHAPETMRTIRNISGEIGCGASAPGVTFCTV